MTKEMRAAIPASVSQGEALEILSDNARAAQLASRARLLLQTRDGVVEQHMPHASLGHLAELLPVRKIGTYKDAPNRVAGHPHVPSDGLPVLLMTESTLELAWLRWFEFLTSTAAMLTQPFALVWPIGEKCIYRIPDFVVRNEDGSVLIVDVKPDAPELRTPYVMKMLELTRLTLEPLGWCTKVAGSMNSLWRSNLRAIASESRVPLELADVLTVLRDEGPPNVGAALDLVGDDDDGMRAILHLLTRELAADLTEPILLGTRLHWNGEPMDAEVQTGSDSIWTDGETTFQVVGMAIDPADRSELMVSIWAGGNDYRTYTIREVIALQCEAKWLTTPELALHADDDELLASLNDDQYNEVLRLERALLEARTGFPTRTPAPGVAPQPEYDPARVGITKRMDAAAAAVGLKRARFYQMWREWEASGRARSALAHGNKLPINHILGRYDDATKEFVRGFIARNKSRSRKGKGKLLAMLAVEMEEAGFERLTEYKLGQLLTELSRGTKLFDDASRRLTYGEKPTKGGQRDLLNKYGAVVEADSTPLDYLVWSPAGQEWLNVWAVFLTCITSKITTVRLTTSPPNSRAFALTLARMMMPPTITDIAPEFQFAPIAPVEAILGPDLWPAVIPNELHLDHGGEYENEHVFEVCTRLRITPVMARPRTPSDKPHIESAIGKFSNFAQLLDGHKGNAVKNRGKHPEREPLLTLQAAQAVMDAALMQAMYEPHSGLPHPMDPHRFLTPVQKYNTLIKDSKRPIRSKANPNLVFELLEPAQGVLSGNEITIDSIVYRPDNPEIMKSLSAGGRNVESRPLRLHYDPMDRSRMFWHVPGTPRWEVLRVVYQGTVIQPFSDVIYNRLLQEEARGRLNRQERLNIDIELRKLASKLSKTKAGRQELAREFARTQEAINDPINPPAEAGPDTAIPNLTVIDGGGEDSAYLDTDDPVATTRTRKPTRKPTDFLAPVEDTVDDQSPDEGDYESDDWSDEEFLGGGY